MICKKLIYLFHQFSHQDVRNPFRRHPDSFFRFSRLPFSYSLPSGSMRNQKSSAFLIIAETEDGEPHETARYYLLFIASSPAVSFWIRYFMRYSMRQKNCHQTENDRGADDLLKREDIVRQIPDHTENSGSQLRLFLTP